MGRAKEIEFKVATFAHRKTLEELSAPTGCEKGRQAQGVSGDDIVRLRFFKRLKHLLVVRVNSQIDGRDARQLDRKFERSWFF